MPRPSDEKREQKRPASPAAPAAAPIEVRVPASGPGAGGASIDGVPVFAARGEEIQQAVLSRLHRIARATGRPVRATIRDERIGFVVPILVSVDGASEFAGEPVRTGNPGTPAPGAEGETPAPPLSAGSEGHVPVPPLLSSSEGRASVLPPSPGSEGRASVPPLPPAPPVPPGGRPRSAPAPAREAEGPWREGPTYVPRQAEGPAPTDEAPTVSLQVVPEAKPGPRLRPDDPSAPHPGPARRVQPTPPDDSEPTQVLRALFERASGASGPETATPPGPRPAVAGQSQEARPPSPPRRPGQPRQPVSPPEPVPVPPAPAEGTPVRPGGTVATSVLRAVPERAPLISATSGPAQMLPGQGAAPAGVVSAPTGVFGPPPVITAPVEPEPAPVWRAPETGPDEPKTLRPDFESDPGLSSASEWRPPPAPGTAPVAEAGEEAAEEEVKEPPVREFDVAESMLAPESGTERPGAAAGPVAESMARINTAVQQGRIEEATGLAELAVTEASAGLGAEHPDVVRLRELTAYIAYLAGDALRSFQLSLDLAGLRRRLGDPRGAYGNVQSAAAAWRAVRDPVQGLRLGHDLIAVWTELAAAEGPAADDLDPLERARSRMDRLAARARDAAGGTRPSPR